MDKVKKNIKSRFMKAAYVDTVYIAKANIPSTAANSIHVMKISEAFADICDCFKLIVPNPANGREDIEKSFGAYGVKPFVVETVKVREKGLCNRYGFPIKSMWKARKARYVITRDPIVAFLSVLCHKQTVLDLHGDLRHLCGRAYRMMLWKKFRDDTHLHLVMITKGLVDYYVEKYNVPRERITVLPDGYTNSNFSNISKKSVLRNEEVNIGYCGGFVQGKGLEVIYQIAKHDLDHRYNLYGGDREEAEQKLHVKFSDNVFFGGYVSNCNIPEILNEQDILLLPNQKQQVYKNEDIGLVTSPLKMFEYMASGRVIIASDIPVLHEVLNDDNCFFAPVDEPEKWVEIIRYVTLHREEAVKKGEKASENVKKYTWDKRAEKMLHLCMK